MRYAIALLHGVGLLMTLGSVLVFIVLNVVVGSSTDPALLHHQRLFVSAISKALTVPGAYVLACAGLATAATRPHPLGDPWLAALVVLEMLVLANSLFLIAPMVGEVTALARSGAEHGRVLATYAPRKAVEDRLGAANFMMLAGVLFLAVRLR